MNHGWEAALRRTPRILTRIACSVIGFLSIGGLVYLAVVAGTSIFGDPGWQVDYLRIFVGIPASVVGGVIGAKVGAVAGARIWPGTAEEREHGSSCGSQKRMTPRENLCPNCGCQPTEGSKTCEWCGADVK